jgi:hypothetical protein
MAVKDSALLSREARLRAIMEEVRREHGFRSILLADQGGLTISYCGELQHSGIAAIAPEFIRIGDSAVRLGEYDSIACVALVLENSHLMIIKETEMNDEKFILVMDTASVPGSLQKIMASLSERIGQALKS